MTYRTKLYNKSNMLYFIIIFLLLFYDSRPIGINRYVKEKNDSSLLFFMLVYLELFYF
mgnify:CR=1 FL=1